MTSLRIKDDCDFYVPVKLKSNNIWDIPTRVGEVRDILEWIEQLAEWDKSRYFFEISTSTGIMHVWFKYEKDAILCALRWSS